MNNNKSGRTIEQQLRLPRPIKEPGHDLVVAIMLASRMLDSEARRLLSGPGLTEAQFNILMLLKYQFSEGASQVELSERILVNRANITGLVDRLERDGLVERSRRTRDRRTNTVVITEKGLKKLAAAEPAYFEGIKIIARGISEKHRRQAMGVLLSLCALMEAGKGRRRPGTVRAGAAGQARSERPGR